MHEENPGRPELPVDPVQRVAEEIRVNAPVGRVWSIVTDVDQMPGTHPQMLSARWLDGATGAELGARFVSENVSVEFGVWQAVSRIVEYCPGRSIAWTIEGSVAPPTVCRFDVLPDPEAGEERTLLRQTYFYDPSPDASPPVARAVTSCP